MLRSFFFSFILQSRFNRPSINDTYDPGDTNRGVAKEYVPHRRRMEGEAKAKVVASVWGTKFNQFLTALAVLHWTIWKKRMNSSFYLL